LTRDPVWSKEGAGGSRRDERVHLGIEMHRSDAENRLEGMKMAETHENKQLLHLVFGGELESLQDVQFRDIDKLDIVGIFPDYQSALNAWKGKAQATVDNAHMRYFIVHMHKLLAPKQ
jgi:hypothetical protein